MSTFPIIAFDARQTVHAMTAPTLSAESQEVDNNLSFEINRALA
jgi:hypothetical protein